MSSEPRLKPRTADCYVCTKVTDKSVATGNAKLPMCVRCARSLFPNLVDMTQEAKR
jgi:hypothetical protein